MRAPVRLWELAAALVYVAAVWGCGEKPSPDSSTEWVGAGRADTTFVSLVHRLSEDGGYFDTDNLISNEASYLHVLGGLERLGVEGGAYIGVGPDQNFSYIAKIRPEVAFILDIRRDNLLQHLFFRALFTLSDTRVEYLSALFGREVPEAPGEWSGSDLEAMVQHLDGASVVSGEAVARVLERVQRFGLALSSRDLDFIEFVHRSFIDAGLDLRFASHNRSPSAFYPTYRDLLLERDQEGRRGNYLASEADYRFLREMQREGRIIPVVGDLAGPHSVAEIGAVMAERGLEVSAFYTSNVEFYLVDAGTFPQFAENVAALPYTDRSVIIRSVFRRQHPETVPGYTSTQLLERVGDFNRLWAEGRIRTYRDLVDLGYVSLRAGGK